MRPLLPTLVLGSALVAGLHRAPRQEEPPGGLVTLWAEDDLTSSVDLVTGSPAGRIVGGQIDLSDAHLAYGVFQPERLTYGLVRDQVTAALDLGPLTVAPFQRATDPAETFPISAFHTLCLVDGRCVFLDTASRRERLKEADAILGVPTNTAPVSFAPQVGHVLLLRWRSARGGGEDRLVKLLVVEHEPGVRVTLRWAPVPGW